MMCGNDYRVALNWIHFERRMAEHWCAIDRTPMLRILKQSVKERVLKNAFKRFIIIA